LSSEEYNELIRDFKREEVMAKKVSKGKRKTQAKSRNPKKPAHTKSQGKKAWS
jgi:hypothetical protein